jgi:hypothetical protein
MAEPNSRAADKPSLRVFSLGLGNELHRGMPVSG